MDSIKTIIFKLLAIILVMIFTPVVLVLCTAYPFILFIALVCAIVWSDNLVGKWGVNVWIGFDNSQSANMGGDPDETISSRLGKAWRKGSGWRYVAALVDFVAFHLFGQKDHCKKSIEEDEGRDQVTRY